MNEGKQKGKPAELKAKFMKRSEWNLWNEQSGRNEAQVE